MGLILIEQPQYPENPENPLPPEPGTPGGPTGPPLPGLGSYMRPRYTCNVAVTEEMEIMDLLHEVIFVSSRMFLTQGANGKIKFHNKKPVDWALGIDPFLVNFNITDLDNIEPWVTDPGGLLLIDPFTTEAEVRTVTIANYSADQNEVEITGDAIFTITPFDGCDGAHIPAEANIEVKAFSADTSYSITIDGVVIEFTTSSADTQTSVAGFLAGIIKGHPSLNRKFSAEHNGVNVELTARFGTLYMDEPLEFFHSGPLASPTVAPTLTAAGGGTLPAGTYNVAYSYKNARGQTRLSPFKSITLTANQKIQVTAVTPPTGAMVNWYLSAEAGSNRIRLQSTNNGSAFDIDNLPLLSATLPPDINRTGAEVMRIKAVFSDRPAVRGNVTRSNVIKATFEWLLGNRDKTVNRIDLKFREAIQDFRLYELRLRDDAHIAKTKKTSPLEVNGQAIDNAWQAYRIAASWLAEKLDADFFYKWSATRTAMLLEEGDVVAIIDSSSGVIALPVMIEAMDIDISTAGLPKCSFTGRKFANTLYDDSVADRRIPIPVQY